MKTFLHEILTWAWKGGSSNTVSRKQIGLGPSWFFSLWPYQILVFSALEYNFTSLEYEVQRMVLTPSCIGLGVDLGGYMGREASPSTETSLYGI